MIRNLPPEFPISALESFAFGSVEAKDDQMLIHCPVPTAAMSELLGGSKDIVLGYRGTGKSAIVRLLAEKKLSFNVENEWKSLVVVLDEEFDYRAIREHLLKHAEDDRSKAMMCRVVWEILVIYRVLQSVQENIGAGDSTINEFIKEIDILLGVSVKKPTLIQILLSHKKKVGVKLDTNLPNIVDFYAGLEPGQIEATPEEKNTILKLADYKKYLNRFLHDHQTTLNVLFDRLDDFVVQEEYSVQKALLQGLLATQVNYREKYPRIKIKAFLRTDLFQRLDLNEFGPDKVLSRCVELKWTPSEIKNFLGKRIAHNLLRNLKLSTLEVVVDQDTLHVTRDELPILEETKLTLSNFNPLKLSHWRRSFWYARRFSKTRVGEGRQRHARDAVNEALISSIFPRELLCDNVYGPPQEVKFLDFLETYFQFSHGHCTPRGLLTFLNYSLNSVRRYYDENRDLRAIKLNPKFEYPLFVKTAIRDAYKEYGREAWEIQFHWAKEKKYLIAELQKLSKKISFSFVEFTKAAGISDEEAKQFLAFTTQTGLTKCMNDREKHVNRIYQFPLLFQQ